MVGGCCVLPDEQSVGIGLADQIFIGRVPCEPAAPGSLAFENLNKPLVHTPYDHLGVDRAACEVRVARAPRNAEHGVLVLLPGA